jgi:biopolymer transport protein ExbB
MYQERIERINDHLKVLMLRACVGRSVDSGANPALPAASAKLHLA